jgi:predicted TIM-barrel fold metal-dependent hydrolase
VLIIDADAHVTEPPDVWTSRVASKDKDRVPHVVRADDGTEWWILDDVQIDRVGVSAAAGWPNFPLSYPPGLDDCLPGAYEAAARLKYMDEAGIWAQVLYPNVAGFGAQRFLKMKDADLQVQCVRAYNDFIHEWSSVDPRRLIPNISLPFWDVQQSVAEVERCLELGFRAILVTGEPQRFGFPILGDKHWDPLYSLAQDASVPLHFHVGGGKDIPFSQDELRAVRKEQYGVARANIVDTVDLSLRNAVQCADLLASGVLTRFPSLNFVSVESGIGWVPFMLETADYAYLYGTDAARKRSDN